MVKKRGVQVIMAKKKNFFKKWNKYIDSYMFVYGGMECDRLKTEMEKQMGEQLTEAEFLKRLETYQTKTEACRIEQAEESGVLYCVNSSVNLNALLEQRASYQDAWDYYEIERDELEEVTDSLCEYYDCLGNLALHLQVDCDLEDEEAQELFLIIMNIVWSGGNIIDILKVLLDYILIDSYEIWRTLWQLIANVLMEVRLPGLKGFSRSDLLLDGLGKKQVLLAFEEYMSLERWDYDPGIVFHSKHRGKIDKKTHLFDLPTELQLELYQLIYFERSEYAVDQINRILRRYGNNIEILLLLSEQYCMLGDFESAIRTIKKARMLDGFHDSSLEESLIAVEALKEIDFEDLDFENMDFEDLFDMQKMEKLLANMPYDEDDSVFADDYDDYDDYDEIDTDLLAKWIAEDEERGQEFLQNLMEGLQKILEEEEEIEKRPGKIIQGRFAEPEKKQQGHEASENDVEVEAKVMDSDIDILKSFFPGITDDPAEDPALSEKEFDFLTGLQPDLIEGEQGNKKKEEKKTKKTSKKKRTDKI